MDAKPKSPNFKCPFCEINKLEGLRSWLLMWREGMGYSV